MVEGKSSFWSIIIALDQHSIRPQKAKNTNNCTDLEYRFKPLKKSATFALTSVIDRLSTTFAINEESFPCRFKWKSCGVRVALDKLGPKIGLSAWV